MDYISVAIQAVVQGLTEFLPVSSSGHLSVLQHFMNIEDESLIISIMLHLGTLIAVIVAFAPTVWGMIKEFFLTIRDVFTGRFKWSEMNDNRRMMFMVIIATVLLVPAYFFKDWFTAPEGDNDIIFEGCAFLFTSLLLFLSDACVKGLKTGKDMKIRDAIVVGAFQIIALFPGVSRSGSTMTSSLFCGLTRETAVTYSFMLGIPAILGGSVLEVKDALETKPDLDWLPLLMGAAISAVVGLLAIKLVKLLIKHDKFKVFGIYTAIIGVFCVGSGIYELVTGQPVTALVGLA